MAEHDLYYEDIKKKAFDAVKAENKRKLLKGKLLFSFLGIRYLED